MTNVILMPVAQLALMLCAQPTAPAAATGSPGSGAASAAAAAVPHAAERSLFQYITAGGFLSYVMVILSIVAVGLVIANLIQLRRQALAKPGLVITLDRLLRDRQVDAAIQACQQKENDCFLARVMRDGLSKAARSPFGMLELKPALEEAGTRELENLDRVNHGLAIMAAVGPMLGLLGTVLGMIGAFGTISRLEGAARSQELADYMSLALVCTAEGLIIAVPCTIAYSLFKKRTDRLVNYVGQVAEALVLPLQAPAGAKAPPAPARAPGNASIPLAPARSVAGAGGVAGVNPA